MYTTVAQMEKLAILVVIVNILEEIGEFVVNMG